MTWICLVPLLTDGMEGMRMRFCIGFAWPVIILQVLEDRRKRVSQSPS